MMFDLSIAALLHGYRTKAFSPTDVIAAVYQEVEANTQQPIWISLLDKTIALEMAKTVDCQLPLAGIPFAIKDNIDLLQLDTTAACPSFAYRPQVSATVVEKLMAAGAIPIGKTNMDQFATGLVGTRSPYGVCSSVFDPEYISGGSSSGSAVAVARRLVSFALGTDTAGSGRVPAAFNGIVGLKPTRGAISVKGVVPACLSLDCVSIFSLNCADAETVWQVAAGADANDPFSRPAKTSPLVGTAPFLFGVPQKDQLEFFGDQEAARLFETSVTAMEAIGGQKVEIDYEPFKQAASLLYSGPWVAERTAAVGEFLAQAPDADSTVKAIVAGGKTHSAVDTFRAQYRLQSIAQQAKVQMDGCDFLLLPTTGTIFTHQQVKAQPLARNTDLGYYTNFVNLLDMAAIAIPAGQRSNGLPFGISLIGPAWSELALTRLAARFLHEAAVSALSKGWIQVAVVGAHLQGQPLHGQLLERKARLVSRTRTSPHYKLFALANTQPPKPGLVRQNNGSSGSGSSGSGIELEVYAMPQEEFGSFVALIPPPLGIGSVQLADGSTVKGFICEPIGLEGATEITSFGGWRAYLASKK
jgi:allophanate hydrolase